MNIYIDPTLFCSFDINNYISARYELSKRELIKQDKYSENYLKSLINKLENELIDIKNVYIDTINKMIKYNDTLIRSKDYVRDEDHEGYRLAYQHYCFLMIIRGYTISVDSKLTLFSMSSKL
jgi:hypothetical protein